MSRTRIAVVILVSLASLAPVSAQLQRCGDSLPACPAGEYCKQFDGACADDGRCAPIPASCPPDSQPVCGCDGVSYWNECEAERAEVSIASTAGPCFDDDCGGAICLAGEYCRRPDGVCSTEGFCDTVPASCTPSDQAVCGCSGASYPGRCEAYAAGDSVADATRPCPDDDCGGRLCAEDEFCARSCTPNYPVPLSPLCRPVPGECPPVDDPVCGCDGAQYPNACEAAAAGISVRYPFPCPQGCAGFSGTACDDPTQQCVLWDICGFDLPGDCLDPPVDCGSTCRPHCSCDGGDRYDSRCQALQAAGPGGMVHIRECDEVIEVGFATPQVISWTDAPAESFNVYRSIRPPPAPVAPWDCLQTGLTEPTATIVGDPPPGTLWMIGVTWIESGQEQPLGVSSMPGCPAREIAAACPP